MRANVCPHAGGDGTENLVHWDQAARLSAGWLVSRAILCWPGALHRVCCGVLSGYLR